MQHGERPSTFDNLERILTRQEPRILSKALTIQYDKVIYQIQTNRPVYALQKAKVMVYENARGEIQILYKDQPLQYTVYHRQAHQAEVVPAKSIDYHLRKPNKPAHDHPWRKGYRAPAQSEGTS